MKIQNWKQNEFKSKKNDNHKTIYFVTKDNNISKENDNLVITSSYQGNWKNDLKHGFGDMVYKNGDLYSGQWYQNMRQGSGTLWVMNNLKKLQRSYVGQWQQDQKEGRGIMFYPNGDKYDGFWYQNQKSGFGIYVFASNDIYIGCWRRDKRNGYGVFLKTNKEIFEGHWIDDLKEGPGSYLFYQQKKILVGEWSQDSLKSGLYSQIIDQDQVSQFNEQNFSSYLDVINPEEILKEQFQQIRLLREITNEEQNYQFGQATKQIQISVNLFYYDFYFVTFKTVSYGNMQKRDP